ncbi:MAG: phage shock protein [Actinomycetota bacterium]|nr:phage shock protein [Actinomycetota bacterium]
MSLPRRAAGFLVVPSLVLLGVLLGGCGRSESAPSGSAPSGTLPASLSSEWSLPASGGSSPGGSASANSVRRLDVAAFAALVASPSVVVLDVRTPQEFASGHLAGARLIDAEAADFDTRVAALDKTTTYALYCRSGNRSGQALQRLTASGFTSVADLVGGIDAWKAAGKPVTTS